MKKIIQNKLSQWIPLWISFLGFAAACTPEFRTEYGVPHADYVVKGKVTSGAGHTPVPGVQVIMKSQNIYENDTVRTDAEGNYAASSQAFPEQVSFHVLFRDVDGSANGSFQPVDSVITYEVSDLKGGDKHWYSGKAEKVVDVNLKPASR